MKSLHSIQIKRRDVPNWVIAWLWHIQNEWEGISNIVYNETGIFCIDNSAGRAAATKRTEPNILVDKNWVINGSPQPDWTIVRYGDLNEDTRG